MLPRTGAHGAGPRCVLQALPGRPRPRLVPLHRPLPRAPEDISIDRGAGQGDKCRAGGVHASPDAGHNGQLSHRYVGCWRLTSGLIVAETKLQLIDAFSDHLLAVQANKHEISRRMRERPSKDALHVAVAHQAYDRQFLGMQYIMRMHRSVAGVFERLAGALDSLGTKQQLLEWSARSRQDLSLIVWVLCAGILMFTTTDGSAGQVERHADVDPDRVRDPAAAPRRQPLAPPCRSGHHSPSSVSDRQHSHPKQKATNSRHCHRALILFFD